MVSSHYVKKGILKNLGYNQSDIIELILDFSSAVTY